MGDGRLAELSRTSSTTFAMPSRSKAVRTALGMASIAAFMDTSTSAAASSPCAPPPAPRRGSSSATAAGGRFPGCLRYRPALLLRRLAGSRLLRRSSGSALVSLLTRAGPRARPPPELDGRERRLRAPEVGAGRGLNAGRGPRRRLQQREALRTVHRCVSEAPEADRSHSAQRAAMVGRW